VRVSADLSSARVFVDVLEQNVQIERVLDGLNAGSGVLRALVGKVVRLRRVPSLRFERDESIERGLSIEQLLEEIHASDADRDAGG
jgi:ribosome-binding factor A